ncbi:hypothetical protein E2C01_014611 [Portunus trituberculatus]|uniref:Uncharacterized protein n=1 Tax=Portunus trituberculatus TaxID=210409 RepID=A0A5B7DJB5_PORTR|nr:hypothetical protein [Portunus trituberculatus]
MRGREVRGRAAPRLRGSKLLRPHWEAEGIFTVLEAEEQDFFIINFNWRNTLDNPANHLSGLGK